MTEGLIPRHPHPDEDGKQRQDGTRATTATQLIENVIHYFQVTGQPTIWILKGIWIIFSFILKMNFVPSIINPIYVLIFRAVEARCVRRREWGPRLRRLIRKSLVLSSLSSFCLCRDSQAKQRVLRVLGIIDKAWKCVWCNCSACLRYQVFSPFYLRTAALAGVRYGTE